MVRIVFLLLLMATQVQAGAWPRAEGEGFLSFSLDADAEDGEDNFFSIYLEYGLGNGRTFGFDRRESGDEIAKTIAFFRWSVGPEDWDTKFAFELGAGIVDNHGAVRPGVSVGRGYALGRHTGWLNLDARGLLYDDLETGLFETEFTVGYNATDRTKMIFQLQAGVPSDADAYAKVAPSIVVKQNASRHLVFGVTAGVVEVDELKVNLGLWQEF